MILKTNVVREFLKKSNYNINSMQITLPKNDNKSYYVFMYSVQISRH